MVTETYKMLRQALGEAALSWSETFEWYACFKNGRTSTDDEPHTQAGHQQHESVRLLMMSMN